MAATPNSGSLPENELEIELASVQPNSGMRHDFIGNSAFFATISDVPEDSEVNLPRDNVPSDNNVSVLNVQSRHSADELPASSSGGSNASTAQAQNNAVSAGQISISDVNTAVSAGQCNMADIRSLLLNLADQMADKAPQNHPDSSEDPNATCLGDSMDQLLTNEGQTVNVDQDDIVNQMNDFFTQVEKCGPEINPDLAKAVCSGFRTKVKKEKRKTLLEMHSRPANCDVLKMPRVNKVVWSSMTRAVRDSDVSSQILQSNVCGVTYPLLALIDKMHCAKRSNKPIFGNDLTECLKLAMDSFKLVQLCYMDITYRRREAIQPHLHKSYKDLCSEDTAVTDLLFGDNLDKRIKDLTDAKNITDKLHHATYRGGYRGSPSTNGRSLTMGRGQYRGPTFTPRFLSPSSSRYQPYTPRGGRRPAAANHRQTTPFLGAAKNSRPPYTPKNQKQ